MTAVPLSVRYGAARSAGYLGGREANAFAEGMIAGAKYADEANAARAVGQIVVDPADPAVIDRVVTTLEDRGFLAGSGTARAVLAALGGDR